MARRAIILDAIGDGTGQQTELRVVLWADVPASRQRFYANPIATSAFLDTDAGELALIRSGAIAETVVTIRRDPGSTNAQIRAAVVVALTDWQALVTARNPWARYGSAYDPNTTVWTGVTVN